MQSSSGPKRATAYFVFDMMIVKLDYRIKCCGPSPRQKVTYSFSIFPVLSSSTLLNHVKDTNSVIVNVNREEVIGQS